MMVRSMTGMIRFNEHHTAHTRGFWEGHPASLEIRENPSMIAHKLGVAAHNLIHKETMAVPVPSLHTIQFVARELPRNLDVLDGIDQYSLLVEKSLRHPRVKPLERELGGLSIRAIREQIPYLKDFYTNKTIL